MKRSKRRISVVVALLLLLVAYAVCYRILPRRIRRDGAYITHLRVFTRDFQPYFFAPAGFVESLIIRVWPTFFWPEITCAQVVDLKTNHVHVRIAARSGPKPVYRPIAWDADIIATASRYFDFTNSIHSADGSMHQCKYWDCDLEKTEDFLSSRFPRPYTLDKALQWFDQAAEEETRAHLVVLLAASRDPRGVLVAASALQCAHSCRRDFTPLSAS